LPGEERDWKRVFSGQRHGPTSQKAVSVMGLRYMVRRTLSALMLAGVLTAGLVALTVGVASATGYPPSPPPPSVTVPPSAPQVAVPPSSVSPPSSGLPFTGAEIAAMTAVGGLLVVGGAGMLAARRRASLRGGATG
jgi:hypothetical protein